VRIEDDQVHLTQEPFSNVESMPSSEYNYEWPIPVFYNNEERVAWLVPSGNVKEFESRITLNIYCLAMAEKCGKSSTLSLPYRDAKLIDVQTFTVTNYYWKSWKRVQNMFLNNPEVVYRN
jgi:hypothetical protein